MIFHLETCCDTFHVQLRLSKCRVTHSNHSSTTRIDCTLLTVKLQRQITFQITFALCGLNDAFELFTNVVEISQSSSRRFCKSLAYSISQITDFRFVSFRLANYSDPLSQHKAPPLSCIVPHGEVGHYL